VAKIQIELPDKLIPVFEGAADVRGAYGGRGSAKTRSFAKMVAVKGFIFGNAGIQGQLLCTRQYMNSLEDSSLEECKRAIEDEPFLAEYYELGDKYIKSKDGRIVFTFAGLDRNIGSIKSKGRILLCWVDEAEPVTDHAFTILVPTLREEGEGWNAELWVTWNPARKTAAVESRFRSSTDPRVKIIQLNWRDNPKFPLVLERQRQRDLNERPDEYDHIWEGAYGNIQGSILGKWVNYAEREGRIHDEVTFDHEGAPLEISSDIGFHDTATWWFWQRRLGGYAVIKYIGESGLDADDWCDVLKDKLHEMNIPLSKLGKIWLPHDARAKTFQSKHTSMERFIAAFGAKAIGVVPQSKKLDQINAAREVIAKCEFNRTETESGVDGLRAWEFKYNEDTSAFSRDPVHNWASHPSDAFAYGCQVMQQLSPPAQDKSVTFAIAGQNNGRITTEPLNTLWKTAPKRSTRI
jgi:phage terminase large subunit